MNWEYVILAKGDAEDVYMIGKEQLSDPESSGGIQGAF